MPEAARLHFTCNPKGVLAPRAPAGPGEQRVVRLPAETNDASFAMTSSYTTMLLSALACLDDRAPLAIGEAISRLANGAEDVLAQALRLAKDDPHPPSRAIFLGSGALTGAARECALKVLELARGKIPTAWDSTLGFRHGPKAAVDERTRVYVLVSGDRHTSKYDLDAVNEIRQQFGDCSVVTIGADMAAMDIHAPFVGNDAWTSALYVLVGQILGTSWSDALNVNVDNPFTEGNLSRVVTGVPLYPFDLAP